MPGIDFNKLRQDITMEEVLNLLSFEPKQRSGDQWYGPCPLHASTSSSSPRHFSVNVAIGRYHCHQCHSLGNQLELWSAFTKLSLYQAAIHLCHQLGREVPWVRHW